VLGALFQLGVFNPMTFAPKAPPGSCQVFRPNGPGTTSFINLEGICSGELPQYVAQFNGQSSYIQGPTTDFPIGSNAISVFAWIKTTSSFRQTIFSYGSSATAQAVSLNVYPVASNGQFAVDFYSDYVYSGRIVNNGSWNFVGFSLPANSNSITMTVNGNLISTTLPSVPNIASGTNYQIGRWLTAGTGDTSPHLFNGSIANVQIYNTSLSANEIQALYLEGIGGAPIRLQNLVGWWPLDGDANDYSGNGNNGVPTNVIFVSNWYSGYTPP